MKRTFIIICLLVSVILTGCNKSAFSGDASDSVTVTYSVSVPVTKAYGEGESVNKVWYALYRPDGSLVKNYEPVVFENGSAVCSVTMMRGQSYKVAFVAQHYSDAGVPTYAVDVQKASLHMPVDAVANSDNYDVFTFLEHVNNYQGSSADAVVLTRKVAQVTFTSNDADWNGAAALGMLPTHSSVILYKVPASFNLLTEAPSTETVSVTYTKSARPGGDGNLAVAFCFVGADDSFTTPADLYLYNSAEESAQPLRTLAINSLPLKSNYKTNVTGAIMTGTLDYNITLDTEATDNVHPLN